MTKNLNIINWENVFAHSKTFQEQKPVKWVFIEEFFVRDFYEKLYETYPKKDDSKTINITRDSVNVPPEMSLENITSELATGGGTNWSYETTDEANSYRKWWTGGSSLIQQKPTPDIGFVEDPTFSESWNQLYRYLFSDELISNFRKFSGIPVNKPKAFQFLLLTRGGYQLPHSHNIGPASLLILPYFSKNWKKGDPGGTYITPDDTESNMIFEPSNLDNTAIIFQDGPHAGHGVRQITKDVERRAVQIYLEKYSSETGWSEYNKKRELREI